MTTDNVIEFPDPELNNRILYCIYKYELDLEDFFIMLGGGPSPFIVHHGGTIGWYVNVSDTFAWACADAEHISEDNIDLFEKVCQWAEQRDCEYAAPLLFVIKARNKKPMVKAKIEYWLGSHQNLIDEILAADLDQS